MSCITCGTDPCVDVILCAVCNRKTGPCPCTKGITGYQAFQAVMENHVHENGSRYCKATNITISPPKPGDKYTYHLSGGDTISVQVADVTTDENGELHWTLARV